jgi:hypothetical protein
MEFDTDALDDALRSAPSSSKRASRPTEAKIDATPGDSGALQREIATLKAENDALRRALDRHRQARARVRTPRRALTAACCEGANAYYGGRVGAASLREPDCLPAGAAGSGARVPSPPTLARSRRTPRTFPDGTTWTPTWWIWAGTCPGSRCGEESVSRGRREPVSRGRARTEGRAARGARAQTEARSQGTHAPPLTRNS